MRRCIALVVLVLCAGNVSAAGASSIEWFRGTIQRMTDDRSPRHVAPEILSHYSAADEHQRLTRGENKLELARTKSILRRFLPGPPARILDVGGGPGAYARWLADDGYVVHLVDVVPEHVEQARAASNGYTVALGDARELDAPDASVDAVLLLGPLYHLTERTHRVEALAEARRVLRPDGYLFAAAISRFASLLDGLNGFGLDDPGFEQMVDRDLRDGQHRNPDNRPGWFTTAYLHRPDELADEVREAGFTVEGLLAVEGPCWLLSDFDTRWQDERHRNQMLDALARVEAEPSMLGVSSHIIAIAR
jgi:SAM-dependent methyltransferase